MKNHPFQKSATNMKEDKTIKKALCDYIQARYPWLKYVGSRKSYSVFRFEFLIKEPDFAKKSITDELAMKLNIVLAAVDCHAFIYRNLMIINVPRENKDVLYLGNGLDELLEQEKSPVRCYLGECDDGSPAIIDFTETPHLLVGGTTGSGKSVALSNILLSLMFKYTPEEVQFLILDDKNELSIYTNVPHVIKGAFTRDAFGGAISVIENELQRRKKIKGDSGMPDIDTYNEISKTKIPHLFIIFDEADTILKRDSNTTALSSSARKMVEEVASEGRSLGTHVIIASQKPESRNIDTTIKSNIAGRLALQVANSIDSRVILDGKGAEKLTGNGDAILKLKDGTRRIQCAFTTLEERREAIKMLCS